MQESDILIDCSTGTRVDEIQVVWDPAPLPPPDACAAARLEARWEAAVEQARAAGGRLFDGAITRLISINRSVPPQPVVLRLGPGNYKAFVITRLHDRDWFERHAPEQCTHALGNSVLLTHGDEALLGIRSRAVSCYPGRAHLIGGVLDRLDTPGYPAHAEGLVAHLLAELHEEAHVSADDLSPRGAWPRLLGIYRDNVLGQPEAIWRWEARVSLADIAARLDAAEHTGHVIVARRASEPGTARPTPIAQRALDAWGSA
jgi:hypothetical protein